MYFGDSNNQRIRKVTVSTGIITTYAGSSNGGYSGDNGQATAAGLYNPWGLVLDSEGVYFIFFYFLLHFSSLPYTQVICTSLKKVATVSAR